MQDGVFGDLVVYVRESVGQSRELEGAVMSSDTAVTISSVFPKSICWVPAGSF